MVFKYHPAPPDGVGTGKVNFGSLVPPPADTVADTPPNLELCIGVAEFTPKLRELSTLIPDADADVHEFGRLLADRIERQNKESGLIPEGFINAANLLIYDLGRNADQSAPVQRSDLFTQRPGTRTYPTFPSELAGNKVRTEALRSQIVLIAAAACPPEFSRGVAAVVVQDMRAA